MYEVFWTPTALGLLKEIRNADTRRAIRDKAKGLADNPESQGRALMGPLKGFRRIYAAGRYRIIYRVVRQQVQVHVLLVGIRKQGDNQDVYELAQKLLKAGLLSFEKDR